MARALVLFFGFCLMLGSCTQRSICPAFQSAYIHDKHELRKKFSYFLEDSTPKLLTASKNKYLVAETTTYRKKIRSLQTVEMKPVFVHVPDSILNTDSVSRADLDAAARSVIDSTFIEDVPAQKQGRANDSVYVITKDRELRLLKYNGADSLVYDPQSEKYVPQKPAYYVKDVRLNIEQDNYMWYLRNHLVLPDVRLAGKQQAAEEKARKGKAVKKKKGLKGFFKNLFRKKQQQTDSTSVPAPPREEFDFIESDSLTQASPPPPAKPEARKSFFSPARKKSKDAETHDPAEIAPVEKRKKNVKAEAPEKKEEGADGF
jgi:hypothetical protein